MYDKNDKLNELVQKLLSVKNHELINYYYIIKTGRISLIGACKANKKHRTHTHIYAP